MANYRTQIDPPMPDRERILAHRDFDSLYDQYQTQTRFTFWRNLYRKPRNFAILVMLIAVGALVLDSSQAPPTPSFALQPMDTLVFEAPVARTFAVSTADSSQLDLGADLSISVPARAWQDSSGSPLTGNIELHARVLRGPSAWFQAGVPRPDTGAMHHLHALHLSATQHGKPVSLRPQRPLRVSWTLDEAAKGAKGYRLDTAKRTWRVCAEAIWAEASIPQLNSPSPSPATFTLNPPTTTALPQKPLQPFGIALRNPDDYPELSPYQQVFWAYVERPGSVNPWQAGLISAETPWEDVRVSKLESEGLYELKFSTRRPGHRPHAGTAGDRSSSLSGPQSGRCHASLSVAAS